MSFTFASVRLTSWAGGGPEAGCAPSHTLGVVGFESGLAVWSGQKSIRHRASIGAKELRSGNEGDGRLGELSVEPIEDGDDMSRLAGIVSKQRPRLIGKRPNNGDLPDPRLEREKAVILQQDHGLIGQLASVCAMFRTVEFLLIDLRVGDHVRRIEHAKPDARGEEANQCGVEVAFRQISLLNGVDIGFLDRFAKAGSEGDALVVHAANYGDRGALRLRGTIAMIGSNVSDCVTVRDHVPLETPLAAQLILQQVLVCARRFAVDRIVGTHHRPCFAFDHGGAECRFVRVHLVVLADIYIGEVARRFWSAVHSVVLGCRNAEVVLGVIALQSSYVGNSHAACEERVFAVSLLSAAPARITENVEIGRPEIQASHNADVPLARVLDVLDAALNANLRCHGMNSRCIERRRKPDRLRIFSNSLVDDPVKGFAPPLVRRNLQPRDGRRVILHLRSFLRERHTANQIGGALLGRELGIQVGRIIGFLRKCMFAGLSPGKALPRKQQSTRWFA